MTKYDLRNASASSLTHTEMYRKLPKLTRKYIRDAKFENRLSQTLARMQRIEHEYHEYLMGNHDCALLICRCIEEGF